MKLRTAILIAIAVFAALASSVYFAPGHGEGGRQGLGSSAAWQRMANPGTLSNAHAFLDHNCSACHTPGKGAEAINCIVCHANDDSILQRQPTAFHSDIGNCRDCHSEHRGRHAEMTDMDHDVLAVIGRKNLAETATDGSESAALLAWLKHAGTDGSKAPASDFVHPQLTANERTLNCASCHQNDDQHFGLFGTDCSSCHEATRWNLPEFRHPSSNSKDCSQCHQAPPSHYMMHFKMISAKVAGKPHAKVSECYTCHQTTSWPDIKGVGWYKHH